MCGRYDDLIAREAYRRCFGTTRELQSDSRYTVALIGQIPDHPCRLARRRPRVRHDVGILYCGDRKSAENSAWRQDDQESAKA